MTLVSRFSWPLHVFAALLMATGISVPAIFAILGLWALHFALAATVLGSGT